jgi:hypothetical protein
MQESMEYKEDRKEWEEGAIIKRKCLPDAFESGMLFQQGLCTS